MDLKKEILFKEIRNHSQSLKLQQNKKICHKFTYQGGIKKVSHAVSNAVLFRSSSKSYNVKALMDRLKSIFFYQVILSNNLVLMSQLSGIYLESWFSWLWGGLQKT